MKKGLLIITISLFYLFSFGQHNKLDRSEKVSQTLVGSWELDYALYTTTLFGKPERFKSQTFHTDTIHFFRDMTFKFRSHNTANTIARTHSGVWEITDKGKKLQYKNRLDVPPFDEPTPDITFPIRIVNSNKIRIVYIVYDKQDSSKQQSPKTPVFFVRIK